MAFANHEIVGDYTTACLAWCAQHSTARAACTARAAREHRAEQLNEHAPPSLLCNPLLHCRLEAGGTLPLAGLIQQFRGIALPSERLRDLSPQRLRMLPMKGRRAAPGRAAGAPAPGTAPAASQQR